MHVAETTASGGQTVFIPYVMLMRSFGLGLNHRRWWLGYEFLIPGRRGSGVFIDHLAHDFMTGLLKLSHRSLVAMHNGILRMHTGVCFVSLYMSRWEKFL